jgi:hypothetical protein
MNVEPEIIKNNMNTRQKETLQLFKERLAKALPKVRVEWAKAYSDTIIEVYIEYDNDTYNYKTGLKTATIATEVEEETDVTIALV